MSDTARIDWRTCAAGVELDLEIAYRLGYTRSPASRNGENVYPHPVRPGETMDGYFLLNPDGLVVDDDRLPVEPIKFYRNFPSWEPSQRGLLRYSASADAALTLPLDDGQYWILTPQPDGKKRAALGDEKPFGYELRDTANTYAEAMCRVWLAAREWRDRLHVFGRL